MKKILIFYIIVISINIYPMSENLISKDFKLIMSSQNMKEEKDETIDINISTKLEMLSHGIASSYIDKIIDYREITGGFEKLEEMKRIKGIGDATYKKLIKFFKINETVEKKVLYINNADDKILKYYGFNKKDIKKINEFIKKNGRIVNNIQLKELITKNMYEKLKDKIRYEENID